MLSRTLFVRCARAIRLIRKHETPSDGFYLLHFISIHPHPPPTVHGEHLLNETRAASTSNVVAPIIVLTQSRLDNHWV